MLATVPWVAVREILTHQLWFLRACRQTNLKSTLLLWTAGYAMAHWVAILYYRGSLSCLQRPGVVTLIIQAEAFRRLRLLWSSTSSHEWIGPLLHGTSKDKLDRLSGDSYVFYFVSSLTLLLLWPDGYHLAWRTYVMRYILDSSRYLEIPCNNNHSLQVQVYAAPLRLELHAAVSPYARYQKAKLHMFTKTLTIRILSLWTKD